MRLEVEAPESRTLILRAPAHLKGLKPMSFILALLALLPFVFRAASVLSRLSCAASRSCILLGEDISDRHFSEQSMPEYPLFQWKKKKLGFHSSGVLLICKGGKKGMILSSLLFLCCSQGFQECKNGFPDVSAVWAWSECAIQVQKANCYTSEWEVGLLHRVSAQHTWMLV